MSRLTHPFLLHRSDICEYFKKLKKTAEIDFQQLSLVLLKAGCAISKLNSSFPRAIIAI
jgi:hypothetical protein